MLLEEKQTFNINETVGLVYAANTGEEANWEI